MARTASEIQTDIDAVRTGINNMVKTGRRYVIGTGPSRREFEAADIGDLRDYLADLQAELADVNGTSGVLMGF